LDKIVSYLLVMQNCWLLLPHILQLCISHLKKYIVRHSRMGLVRRPSPRLYLEVDCAEKSIFLHSCKKYTMNTMNTMHAQCTCYTFSL